MRSDVKMTVQPTISACWIVKNEALFLAPSIASVAGVADELLVGDTGSTDRSIEIARDAGARVVSIPWSGSYAEARNAVIQIASGSWILFLDGDELLEASHREMIRQLAADEEAQAYYLNRRHYLRTPSPGGILPISEPFPPIPIDTIGYALTHDVRLFRGGGRYQYQGRIHESLEGSLGAHRVSIIRSSALIHHFGPFKPPEQLTAKVSQYVALAAERCEQEPDNWKALFDYSVELARAGRHDQAIELLQRGIAQFPEQLEIQLELGVLLFEVGRGVEAIEALRQVVEARPHWVRGWYALGRAFLRERDFLTAILCFEQCQRLTPDEGLSLLYWGMALLLQGHANSALEKFSRVEALFPQLPHAQIGRRVAEVLIGRCSLEESALTAERVALFGEDDLWRVLCSTSQR